MKELILYYSYGGSTRALAQALAAERGADSEEVKDVKRPSMVGAFLRCPAAIGQKPGKIQPIKADLAAYDSFVVMGPIWAGHPAPPVNSILAALPKGARVELRMVSSGGASEKAKVEAHAKAMGLAVTDYVDVTSVNPQSRGK